MRSRAAPALDTPPFGDRLTQRSVRLLLVVLLVSRIAAQDDCTLDPTQAELKARPWFCRTLQTVSDDLPDCLGNGQQINWTNPGLCRGRWQWFQLSTVQPHEVPYYVTEQPADGGPAVYTRKTRTVEQKHAVAFTVQASHCPWSDCESMGGTVRDYYTTVDVLVIDGDPLHPWDTTDPYPQGSFAAYYRGDGAGEMYRYYRARKSVSMTLGYNGNHTESCEPRLKDKVNIGVYCSWNPSLAVLKLRQCAFTVRAHLIPETVYDGYKANLPIAPAGTMGNDDSVPSYDLQNGLAGPSDTQKDNAIHHFKVEVGDFDVVQVNVTRTGNNLTQEISEYSCKVTELERAQVCNNLFTAGHGMQGHLIRTRGGECPNRTHNDVNASIHEYTETVSSTGFCTTAETSGTYRFAIAAADEFGPFYENQGYADSEGMVGPDHYPLHPRDSRGAFKQQPGYGNYELDVHHKTYYAGELTSGEYRPTCLSYGQWRYFTITTSGASDASLLMELTSRVSHVYMRADATPTAQLFDVRAPADITEVSGTPCDVVRSTVWHVALMMDELADADTQDVAPAEFGFTSTLESAVATLDVPVVPPESLYNESSDVTTKVPGRGYVCCEATRNYRVADVPESGALNLRINVTSGTVRAIYLKWNSCPRATDVDQSIGACRGFCALAFLATRGGYSGVLYNTSEGEVQIPSGQGFSADKRRVGAWYLSVQALPDIAATYTLTSTLVTPPTLGGGGCNRYTMACPDDTARDAWRRGPPAAPYPPPGETGEMGMTDKLIARGLPTVFAVLIAGVGAVGFQHLRRRRLHQRIQLRV